MPTSTVYENAYGRPNATVSGYEAGAIMAALGEFVPLPGGLTKHPLSDAESRLLCELWRAHERAARDNPNASKEVAVAAFQGSGSMTQALAAGLLTTGAKHAPLAAARHVWRSTPKEIEVRARAGEIIPGFGNTFHPDGDPAWNDFAFLLQDAFPEAWQHVVFLTERVQGIPPRRITANAALYTAAACDLLEVPDGAEILFFLLPRLGVWVLEALAR